MYPIAIRASACLWALWLSIGDATVRPGEVGVSWSKAGQVAVAGDTGTMPDTPAVRLDGGAWRVQSTSTKTAAAQTAKPRVLRNSSVYEGATPYHWQKKATGLDEPKTDPETSATVQKEPAYVESMDFKRHRENHTLYPPPHAKKKPNPCKPSLYPDEAQLEAMKPGHCDLAFTPAQCSLYKLGMRAIKLEEECLQLAAQYEIEIRALNRKAAATEIDCESLNRGYGLGVRNKCCVDAWDSGCDFTAVKGSGGVSASVCRQFRPPMQGSNAACHYAHAQFDPATRHYSGQETVQNKASTNFFQCTKWEHAHDLVTIVNSRDSMTYDAPSGGDSAEDASKGKDGFKGFDDDDDGSDATFDEPSAFRKNRHGLASGRGNRQVETPTKRVRRKRAAKQHSSLSSLPRFPRTSVAWPVKPTGQANRAFSVPNIAPRVARTDVTDIGEDSSYTDIEYDQGSTSHPKPFEQYETTISVITKAKKQVECSYCDTTFKRRSLVPGENDGPCQATGASQVCRTKKTVRCERICFLIGLRGRALRGESRWLQGFNASYCPAGKVIQAENPSTASTQDTTMNLTQDTTILTETDAGVGAEVTLMNVTDTMKHHSPEVQRQVLSDLYQSDDLNLQLCCFPGCVLPTHSEDGTIFPWYWDNSKGATGVTSRDTGLTLQETASTQAAHLF